MDFKHVLSFLAMSVIVALIAGCNKAENEDLRCFKNISLEEWPLTDCSTSTSPVRDLVAYKLLGVPYEWEQDWMGGTLSLISNSKTRINAAAPTEHIRT